VSGVALVLALLIAVVVVVSLATRLAIAYPILLVVAGGLIALVPGLPVVRLDPDLILVLFLPPLVYSTSLGTSRFELKANRRPILALAVGLVLLTMAGVAAIAHALVPGMGWPVALTLGAVVAPPDPIAAAEVAGRVGLPSRLLSILEGEGLINDGTALTAYQLALSAVGGTVTVLSVGEAAVRAFAFGIGIGLVAGFAATRVLRLVDDPLLENTILLMLPFAAYLPANAVGGSGVLAVLTAGLWYARDGRPVLSAAGRLQQRTIWQLVAFLLTGLSFLLVGLSLHDIVRGLGDSGTGIPGGAGRAVLTFTAVCAAVVVLRFVGVFAYAALPGGRVRLRPGAAGGPGVERTAVAEPRHRLDRPASWRSVTVIGWAGMRGAVSLAAALAIPARIPYRGLVIALTFAVIVVTLVGQGLTLPWLVRRLHVVSPEGETEFETLRARHRLTVAGLRRLVEIGGTLDDESGEDADGDAAAHAEALARASALYQRQLDHLEVALADFDDPGGVADGAGVPDLQAAREVRAAADGQVGPRPALAPTPEDAAAAGIPEAHDRGPRADADAAAVPGVLDGAGSSGRPADADAAASGDPDAVASGDPDAPASGDPDAPASGGPAPAPAPDDEARVRALFRGYVDDVRATQRTELERLERRGSVGRGAAEVLRSRLDLVEIGLPAVPHL